MRFIDPLRNKKRSPSYVGANERYIQYRLHFLKDVNTTFLLVKYRNVDIGEINDIIDMLRKRIFVAMLMKT